MTNLDSIFKSRDITLPTKVRLVKAMVFPVVMYGCESWTVKKAERRRIDAFELWGWRRLLPEKHQSQRKAAKPPRGDQRPRKKRTVLFKKGKCHPHTHFVISAPALYLFGLTTTTPSPRIQKHAFAESTTSFRAS